MKRMKEESAVWYKLHKEDLYLLSKFCCGDVNRVTMLK